MHRPIAVFTGAILIALTAITETATPEPQQQGLASRSSTTGKVQGSRTGSGGQPSPASMSEGWPQWRGPLGTGEAPSAKPPLSWDAGKNIKWKTEVPGVGKSTPIVWKDLVFLTAAVPTEPGDQVQFTVIAVQRNDGRVRWQRVVRTEKPHEGTHRDGSFAGPSAMTEGKRVYASFGSRGIYALDFTGRVLWEKDLGDMQTRNGFGEGSSAALHGDTIVVNWDHEGDDFVVALESATGRERWRRPRNEPTTWTTPHIVTDTGRAQVVVGGTNRVISYDLATGEPVWETGGLTLNVIPTPVSGGGMLFAMSGFRGSMARAIRLREAKGVVSGEPAQAWTYERDTPYVPSPLLYRGALYFLKLNSGILTCLDAATGTPHYTERLEPVANVYASPVAADGRVYIVGRDGTTAVLAAGPKMELLATNRLDDPIDASPAVVDGEIYLRGAKHLYRISE
jgi:outer membrane protein assembly factor BamB